MAALSFMLALVVVELVICVCFFFFFFSMSVSVYLYSILLDLVWFQLVCGRGPPALLLLYVRWGGSG